MNENEKTLIEEIQEGQLEDISGGSRTAGYFEVISRNSDCVASGATPKYRVGQQLFIFCRFKGAAAIKVPCEVIDVSSTANCGIRYKEFGYKIRFLSTELAGKTYSNVYENCLYEN